MKLFKRIAVFIIKNSKAEGNAEIIKKQALLNPAAGGYKEAERYRVEKLSEMLLVLFLGIMLAAAATIYSAVKSSGEVENYRINRNGYGGGDRIVDITAEVGDGQLKEEMKITVGERQYSEEETEEVFEEAGRILEERILGENTSLDRVEYDLNLVNSLEEYPISIDWAVDDYSVLDSSGIIQEEVTDENGVDVVLTATLEYMGRYEDLLFPAVVFPRHREAEGKIRELILRKIARYEKLTISGESLILPDKVGDTAVSYRTRGGTEGLLILMITFISIFIIWYGRDRDLDKRIRLREKEMLKDYPDIVSRLSLFFSAGMTIRGAFEKIAGDYEEKLSKGKTGKRYALEEMLITVREMKGGIPESQAYQNFGTRSGVRRYGKLGTLLSQNLQKGNSGLREALEYESREAFEDRKADARRSGEEAGTRLLLPMGIMLAVVMIIVLLPAFMSFSI